MPLYVRSPLSYPPASSLNVVQPTGDAIVALSLKQHSGTHSAALLKFLDSSGNALGSLFGAAGILQGLDGSGADQAGSDLLFASGRSTGAGTGGSFKFRLNAPGGSSSSLNALYDKLVLVDNLGSTLYQNSGTGDYLRFESLQAASGGNTLRRVPGLFFRGYYWTGAVSQFVDVGIDLEVSATTPAYQWRVVTNGQPRLWIGQAGLVSFAATHLANARVAIQPEDSTSVILRLRGAAAQSGQYLLWEDNTPTELGRIDSSGNIQLASARSLNWNADTYLVRDAANTLAQRNSTTAQTFQIYNTFTDASNYERALIRWAGNTFQVLTQAAGTGTTTRRFEFGTIGAGPLRLTTSSTGRFEIDGSTGHFLAVADNTYDIGVSGATRPRSGYFGTAIVAPLHQQNGANGQSLNIQSLSESTTIAAAATTDTVIQIPAGAIVVGVSVRVTTVIPTATTFDVGIAGATTRYGTAISTAATTTYPGTDDGTRFYASAVSIRFTPNAVPGAATGVVRSTIHYFSVTPATS